MNNDKAKKNWGQSQAVYMAALENKWVKVTFLDGKVLKGVLTGVDTYEIFIRPAKGPEVWISKGAIKYLHPASADVDLD